MAGAGLSTTGVAGAEAGDDGDEAGDEAGDDSGDDGDEADSGDDGEETYTGSGTWAEPVPELEPEAKFATTPMIATMTDAMPPVSQ
ncbi:hypothetical protein [Actinoallomurus vinaceus]